MVALIVEGWNDVRKIRESLEDDSHIAYIVTNGTRIDNKIKSDIEKYENNGYNVYILSDPDSAGDTLANMILKHFPSLKRIYVDRTKCEYFTPKRVRYGIEFADVDYLRETLKEIG